MRFNGRLGGAIEVDDDLVLNARGHTIDADGVDRIFTVADGARLVIKNARLRGGAPAAGESGGAVLVNGSLVVRNTSMLANKVTGTGASGGAVFNDDGEVLIADSRLARNTATRAGGAIEALEGLTQLIGTRLVNNSTGAEPGNGGGVHLTGGGAVEITSSWIGGNTAGAEGGGLWNSADGTFLVDRTRIEGNTAGGAAADQGGGGIYNDGGFFRSPAPRSTTTPRPAPPAPVAASSTTSAPSRLSSPR